MLHVWLVPTLVVMEGFVCGFYYVLHRNGGDGHRTDGQCVSDHASEADADDPASTSAAADHNFIRIPPGYQAIRWAGSHHRDGGQAG